MTTSGAEVPVWPLPGIAVLPARGRHHPGRARCQDRPGPWSSKNGDPGKGQTGTSAPLVVKDKVLIGISGGEFGVQCHVTAYDLKSGKQVWRAFSEGPDDQVLLDPDKTTEHGKPVGKDLSLKTWQGDQWKVGGGAPGAGCPMIQPEPRLLRLRQSLDLESEAASGRQQMVDDHLRAQSG